MGTSRSPAEYAAKMARAAEVSKVNAAESTKAGADLMKRTILARAPGSLRNLGKSGSKLNVRYTGGTYEGGAKYLVFAQGRGWPIIERGTRPHIIPRLAGSRSKTLFGPAFGGVNTRRTKPVVVNGQPFAHVFHPGSRGRHVFEHGVDVAMPLIQLQYATKQSAALRTVF